MRLVARRCQGFACGGGYTTATTATALLTKRCGRSSAAELHEPEAAATLRSKADQSIVDRAYWVSTVSSRGPSSSRAGPRTTVRPDLGRRRRPGVAALMRALNGSNYLQ
jgi:hypothetical protein